MQENGEGASKFATMHPVVRDFYERRPRAYGTILLAAAVGLTRLWRKGEHGTLGLIAFTVMLGLCGVLYLLFGRKCNDWNARFVAAFPPNNISWKQAVVLSGFGFGILAIWLWIFRLQ